MKNLYLRSINWLEEKVLTYEKLRIVAWGVFGSIIFVALMGILLFHILAILLGTAQFLFMGLMAGVAALSIYLYSLLTAVFKGEHK